jgi:AraC-like DNA-binding protein
LSTVFETDDLEVAQHFLERMYGSVRLNPGDGQGRFALQRQVLGPIELHHTTLGTRFTADMDDLPFLVVGRVNGGTMSVESARGVIANGPGDVFLSDVCDRPYRTWVDDLDLDMVVLDPALVAEAAGTMPCFTGNQPLSPSAGRRWGETLSYVRDHVLGTAAMRAPLLAANAAQLLVSTALATFPSTARLEPTIEDRHDAHPATARRAVAFIDDNAAGPVSVAQIAAAAGVTVRAVNLAFRRHLDTTPGAYLRRARLQHAHHDLRDADPASTTIAEVAARWGFGSKGGFVARYWAAYGRSPARTLREG